jgi:hypothetical protein
MPASHIAYPDDYEACGTCSGTGTVTRFRDGALQRDKCPNPSCHSGSIRKLRKRRPSVIDPGSGPKPPIVPPPATTKEELRSRYEQARDEAAKLKQQLLNDILTAPEFSSEERRSQAHSVIDAIDPAIGSATNILKSLLEEWRQGLPADNPLLINLELFESVCFRVDNYKCMLKYHLS